VAKADNPYVFLNHGSEHKDRRGSETLVFYGALNDRTPFVDRQQRPYWPNPQRSFVRDAKAKRLRLEGEV